jgi:hypothetical protein
MELNVSGPVSPQSLTKISPVEQKKKHCAWINPILGATHPDYLRNRPAAWLNGFSIVELYTANGFFNLSCRGPKRQVRLRR